MPCNPGNSYAANTLFSFRTFRIVDGVISYDLTSASTTLGSRNSIAGFVVRPVGYDANDPLWASWEAIDNPGTTSTVTYG